MCGGESRRLTHRQNEEHLPRSLKELGKLRAPMRRRSLRRPRTPKKPLSSKGAIVQRAPVDLEIQSLEILDDLSGDLTRRG